MAGANAATASVAAMEEATKALLCWQDREVRFDVPQPLLALRTGETLVDEIGDVEDTKGNNGEHGALHVTSLRIVWTSSKSSKTNLSIGFNTIVNVVVRQATSRLRGQTQAVFVHSKQDKARFEFIFTNLVPSNPRLYSSIYAVFQAYNQSRLYRELKLRASVVREKQLVVLPEEQIYSRTEGVWNLSSDQGNLGTFYVTNVRVVWFANLAESFNVSIPFMQIKSIRVRESKFGLALVVETAGFLLGFKIDPLEQLKTVAREIYSLHQLFSREPIFGVTSNMQPIKPSDMTSSILGGAVAVAAAAAKGRATIDDGDDVVVAVSPEPGSESLAQYYADPKKNADREPVFSLELGLAIEELREGVTIQSLWQVS